MQGQELDSDHWGSLPAQGVLCGIEPPCVVLPFEAPGGSEFICVLHNPGQNCPYWKEDSSLPNSAVEQDRFCFSLKCSSPGQGLLCDSENPWHCCGSFPLQANDDIKHFFLGRAAFLL